MYISLSDWLVGEFDVIFVISQTMLENLLVAQKIIPLIVFDLEKFDSERTSVAVGTLTSFVRQAGVFFVSEL